METKILVFKFDGPNVNIQAFGKDFISLLDNVYQFVDACSDIPPVITSIENNCVTIKIACSALSMLALNGSGTVKDPIRYNVAVKAINAFLHTYDVTLQLDDGSIHLFKGTSELPIADETHYDIQTTMSIYGELVDVGGENPNVIIRSDAFRDDVKVITDRSTAKKLSSRLYDQVGINAMVTIRDGKVLSGKVISVIDYEPQPIDEWLRANENTLGIEAFRGVDIDAFIAEQRV